MSRMPRVLVSGATSQIGVRLLPRLVHAGFDVFATSRSRDPGRCDGVNWLHGDISGAAGISGLPRPIDAAIHLAPLSLLPAHLPTLLAHGCRRIICFGTTSRHAKAASANAHEQAFAAAQVEAEREIARQCSAAGAHWTVFRPTLIYGCGMDRNVSLIARIIRRFGVFPLFGAAAGRRQPVHADDLAIACMAVLDARAAFDKAYDLTGGETLSYREMVRRIFDALGRPPRFVAVPMALFRFAMGILSLFPRFRDFNAEMARRMNEDLVFDCTPAVRDFGYSPRTFQPQFDAVANDAR